ncbi:MAG: hypothetical protein HWN80_10905 [Candidatus Lokiarchaeota archaeon]|nr:hypothetical protein [Candidatus Lokiarchaeota archaeon]
MTFDIFHVDWITVDIIIIVLLILLLIGVKVLKEVYRWRFFFSNASTIRRVDRLPDINTQFSTISIKKCALIMSNISQQENLTKPTIIIIRRYRKLMLLKALTEAFCSFGYSVINLQLRSLPNSGTNGMASEVEEELHQTFPAIIKYYNQDIDTVNQEYNVIDFNKRLLPYNFLLKDSDCRSLILINPRLESYNLGVISTLLNDSNKYPQLITIFSEKLNPVFKNKKVKKILLDDETFKNSKHTIIQKAKSRFKNYETILLSIIIRYIEKK